MPSRRQFLAAGVAAAAGTVGLYTWLVEPHWVEVVRREMPLGNLPGELAGRTLLQISDLHVGPRVDSDYLIATLRRAAALEPDFVALTGDFVSYRSAREYGELARVLAHVPHGRLGTVAVLGNHDYGLAWAQPEVAAQIARVVADAGALVLHNASAQLGGLQFAGVSDFWSPEFDPAAALGRVNPSRPTVVLCHNPDALDEPVWGDLRGWVLAGHTHGGQCKPPFLPPPVLPVRNKRYTAGAFDVGPDRTLYINRGVGHLIRARFNVRPELTQFELRVAESPSR